MSAEPLHIHSNGALAFPKPVRLEDEDYSRFIRRQPCVVSGVQSEAHHVVPEGGGKVGAKVSDYRQVPLSFRLHREYHRIGRQAFERKYNIDLDLVQIQYLEMYLSALKDGTDLGARS
jgi:hypothetical protein